MIVFGAALTGAFLGTSCAIALLPRNPLLPIPATALPLLAMFTLPFTLLGSVLLGIVHMTLFERVDEFARTSILLIAGPAIGALMLVSFFWLLPAPNGFYLTPVLLLGAGFGLATSLAWLILRHLTRNRVV